MMLNRITFGNVLLYVLRINMNVRMENPILKRDDLVYPELCFQIVGILFEFYNELGYGHSEKINPNAVAVGLEKAVLKFKKEKYYPLLFKIN